MTRRPTLSLVVTTYEWPAALELTLRSAMRQRVSPLEIIVGDDGSGGETRDLVGRLGAESPVPVQHVWHEDQGFRLSMIRNKAIARARGEYVVMVDGDMVLHPDFTADHADAARTGRFTQGTRVLLSRERTAAMVRDGDLSVSWFDHGLRNRKNTLRLPLLSRTLLAGSGDHRGVRGCNMAFWRADVVRVNGFDEAFEGWGREDSDFVVRLLNAGVRRQTLRFSALAYHQYHEERPRADLGRNDELLARAIAEGRVRAERGIDQYLGDGTGSR